MSDSQLTGPMSSGDSPLQFSAGEDSMTGGRRARMSSRRSSRIAYRKRRASMGGKRRRSRKNKRSRKGRK